MAGCLYTQVMTSWAAAKRRFFEGHRSWGTTLPKVRFTCRTCSFGRLTAKGKLGTNSISCQGYYRNLKMLRKNHPFHHVMSAQITQAFFVLSKLSSLSAAPIRSVLWADFLYCRIQERRNRLPAACPSHALIQTIGLLPLPQMHRTLRPSMACGELLDRPFRQRAAVRYKLRLPVIFRWNDGVEHTSGGFTSDVAMDGALILSSECPPVGSEVRVEVLLPSPGPENGEFRIGCAGTVVHSSNRSGYSAFGFHGVFHDEQLTRLVLHIEQ